MTTPIQELGKALQKRLDLIKAKEAELADRERRVAYREENVARRERIINGKSNA